ncbi:MAG: D-alanyl-D-alanine carboxypeptidase [Eubacterium sp.]|nr:D-alanyl-D-alanine carboxypeptidase [Eubacterium sp.]
MRKWTAFIASLFMLSMLAGSLMLPAESYAAIEPTLKAKAGIVYCENTGEVVFTKDEDRELQPYSVTKLMTAIVTVMHTPLDKEVKVSAKAASQGGSTAGLKQGEKVTVEQLLYGALVQSGNDAAFALAEASSGSVDKFVKQMNKTAKNIGCKNTHFTNPAGISDNNNYTTCSDMLLIVKIAFDNETIREIAGTAEYTMKPTNKSGVRQYHSGAFKLDESVYVGKNGQWFEACTTALGCEVNGLNLYIILLGDTQAGRKTDVKALLKYCTEKIDGVLAVKGGEKVGSVHIRHGAVTKLDVYTANDGYAYIPTEGSRSLIKTEAEIYDNVYAPVKAGDQVGVYSIKVGGEVVNEVPLVIKESVEEGWPTSYLGISNKAALIAGIILFIVLLALLIIFVVRLVVMIKRKRERKKKAMEIARREMEEEEERSKRGWTV